MHTVLEHLAGGAGGGAEPGLYPQGAWLQRPVLGHLAILPLTMGRYPWTVLVLITTSPPSEGSTGLLPICCLHPSPQGPVLSHQQASPSRH